MKKFIRLIALLLAALLVLTSCAGDGGEDADEQKQQSTPHPRDLDGKFVVMIDPGHGFGDVGCTSEYINCYEKDINLSVALYLRDLLRDRGVTVIMSHDGESFINEAELTNRCDKLGIQYKAEAVTENNIFYAYERALYAMVCDSQVGVDMFVSLHVNAIDSEEINGFELYYCSDNPEAERVKELCDDIADSLQGECDVRAYPADDAYIVTKNGTFPSFLFEMGYATNENDAKNLTDEKWQRELAQLLSDKIFSCITKYGK